jgi:hypothetical protein
MRRRGGEAVASSIAGGGGRGSSIELARRVGRARANGADVSSRRPRVAARRPTAAGSLLNLARSRAVPLNKRTRQAASALTRVTAERLLLLLVRIVVGRHVSLELGRRRRRLGSGGGVDAWKRSRRAACGRGRASDVGEVRVRERRWVRGRARRWQRGRGLRGR